MQTCKYWLESKNKRDREGGSEKQRTVIKKKSKPESSHLFFNLFIVTATI